MHCDDDDDEIAFLTCAEKPEAHFSLFFCSQSHWNYLWICDQLNVYVLVTFY